MLYFQGRCPELLLVAALLPGCLLADDVVTVAVASNFSATVAEISAAFTEKTGVPVRMSPGSTGKLYAQVVNGAPFDVFLAADTERPRLLEQSGHVEKGSRRSYAVGSLVLWSRDAALAGKSCRDALQQGDFNRLALANPETAPYGSAAREYLKAAGLWEDTSGRAVYGENISQTLQFVATGNATLGFVARSQLVITGLPTATCTWTVPAASHTALQQQVVLLSRARNNKGARRFFEFLATPAARKIVEQHGYRLPK